MNVPSSTFDYTANAIGYPGFSVFIWLVRGLSFKKLLKLSKQTHHRKGLVELINRGVRPIVSQRLSM